MSETAKFVSSGVCVVWFDPVSMQWVIVTDCTDGCICPASGLSTVPIPAPQDPENISIKVFVCIASKEDGESGPVLRVELYSTETAGALRFVFPKWHNEEHPVVGGLMLRKDDDGVPGWRKLKMASAGGFDPSNLPESPPLNPSRHGEWLVLYGAKLEQGRPDLHMLAYSNLCGIPFGPNSSKRYTDLGIYKDSDPLYVELLAWRAEWDHGCNCMDN